MSIINPGRRNTGLLDTVMKGVQIAQGLTAMMRAAEPEQTALQQVTTTDAAGKPVTKFVRAAEGAEYAKYEEPRAAPKADTSAADRLALEREKFQYQKQRDDADRKAKVAQASVGTPVGGQKPLNAEERKRLDSASMGLAAVRDMGTALAGGTNTFSLVGDNDFTAARTRFEEALGRMQSGGAINNDEAARFRKMAPTFTDDAEMQKKKMGDLYREMALRIQRLGADPETVLAERESIEVPDLTPTGDGTARAAGGPKAPKAPKVGTVDNGYIFKGGDPADPANWEKQ